MAYYVMFDTNGETDCFHAMLNFETYRVLSVTYRDLYDKAPKRT